MGEREKPEDFELDSGISWPQFDHMTADEKAAYYKEHPFPYRNLDAYTAAVRRWILWTYKKETEENMDHCIEKYMRWISEGFRNKTPIDLVSVDLTYLQASLEGSTGGVQYLCVHHVSGFGINHLPGAVDTDEHSIEHIIVRIL